MFWDDLPLEIIKIILYYRKKITCSHKAIIKIQSMWRCYKIKALIKRFKIVRYLKEFKKYNPNIHIFLLRSRL